MAVGGRRSVGVGVEQQAAQKSSLAYRIVMGADTALDRGLHHALRQRPERVGVGDGRRADGRA